MGWFDKFCVYCENKPGMLSEGFICTLKGIELDQKSDLFLYGCRGGWGGHKYCPYHTLEK